MNQPYGGHRDSHSWVSFEHDDETWLFDLSFILSKWRCIWGDGCVGVGEQPDESHNLGCCVHGACISDAEDLNRVQTAASRLDGAVWQNATSETEDAFEEEDEQWATATLDGACVFLNDSDFVGGAGCALHIGAVREGEEPMSWKPDVCWQLPIRFDHHTDDNGHITNFVRGWRRHDWGSGGEDFSWWCTEEAAPYSASVPVLESLRSELCELVGVEVVETLEKALADGPPATPVELKSSGSESSTVESDRRSSSRS